MDEEQIENIEETPEEIQDEQMLDEQPPESLDQDITNDNVDDSELDYGDDESSENWGRKEFEKTLEDKDYYKKEADDLEKKRQEAEEEAARDYKYEDEDENKNPESDENSNKENTDENNENPGKNDLDSKDNNESNNENKSSGTGSDKEKDKTNSEQKDESTNDNESGSKENKEEKKEDTENGNQSSTGGSDDAESGKNKYIEEDKKKKKNSENKDDNTDGTAQESEKKESDDAERKKREKTDKEKKEDQKNLKAAKAAQMQNKIDNVKSMAYQVLHPVEASKAKVKAAIKKFINTHPWIIFVALGIVAGLILLVIIICLFISIAGAVAGKGDTNTYSYSGCATSSSGSLIDFIYGFEGATGSCSASNNKPGYSAVILPGEDVVTAGAGVTNYALLSTVSKNAISQNKWGKYFRSRSSNYYMEQGDCIPQEILDTLAILNIENNYGQTVLDDAATLGLDLSQHEIDAMTSLAYNSGSVFSTLEAYKNGGLEGMWNNMKEIVHVQNGSIVPGLLSRRKAEFALFVTGDYTDQGLFYNRHYEYGSDKYNNYDSEGVIERSSICSSFVANSEGLTNIDGYLARFQRPARTNAYYYMQDNSNYGNLGLEGECAWYAAYRAREILATMGSSKVWTSQRNGGDYCNSDEVLNRTFKTSTDYKAAKPGSLISWANGSYGHVAVVEQVTESGITISEAGIGFGYYVKDLGNTSEYMWNTYFPQSKNEQEARKDNCEENSSGCFNSRTIAFSDIPVNGGSNFQCYIYLLED